MKLDASAGTRQTVVCRVMVVNVVRRRIIWWIATDVDLVLTLVHAYVVDEHLGGECHRGHIDCLQIRCTVSIKSDHIK